MAPDQKTHYAKIRDVLIIVLILNWVVAAAKIVYGLLTKCASMTADGFHSLSDGTSNIIGIVGIGFSARPTDEDHPYGHKKFETLFSLGIAALLFVVAFNLAKEGLHRLFVPVVPEINLPSFIVMLATLGVNIFVMRYEYRVGKRLGSDILVIDSMHTRADIFTSLSVIITLVAVKIGFPIIDPLATLMIAGFITVAAFQIVREQSGILVDAAVITDVKKIEAIALSVKEVKSCHKIRSRGRPDDIHIDLHIQLSPDTHLDEAHRVSYAVEAAIKQAIPEISDILVHVEPKEKEAKPHHPHK